jgi:hypothetical protein
MEEPPNMRVQRTRVLLPAVARRSPLTRGPLGDAEDARGEVDRCNVS